MKTILKHSIIVLAVISFSYNAQSQNRPTKTNSGQAIVRESLNSEALSSECVKGQITVKLKKGIGDFGKQTGVVSFGINSLDEKVSNFEVYQLEKRFRYNPAKLRGDLPDLSRIYKVSFPEYFSISEVAEAFSSDPNVEYAEAYPVIHAAEVPNDALYSQCQHLPQIHAPEAWAIHKGENGAQEIVIAINDTGVDWDHEDLQSNIWQNLAEDADGDGHTMEFNGTQWVLDPDDLDGHDDEGNGYIDDLLGWNFITSIGDPYPIAGNPFFNHGTHCAGIADGATNNGTGIASISWNLKVMAICMDADNTGPYAFDGIIYAAENGADIISNSWISYEYLNAGQEVVTYAKGLGSIVIAAAGNESNSVLLYPASYLNVISVASVNLDDTKAEYSSYNYAVDVSAPGGGTGGGILSTIPGDGYETWSGTSMATPMVAGCFGLLKSYHPDWTNDQLITQLLGTADNINTLNPDYDNMLGTGRVNAYRMLTEENILPFLKLIIISENNEDANGNGINEPGEIVTLNFTLQNYGSCYGSENVNISITSEDTDITIISGTGNINIPPDSLFRIEDQLQMQVGVNASCHFAELTLHFESDIPIVAGQDINFTVLVHPSGILVFEGENGQDYSGTFIASYLDQLGYDYMYSNTFNSLLGFQAVFLSFGNWNAGSTPLDDQMASVVIDYLEAGGYVYLEGGDVFGWDQPDNADLLGSFGLTSVADGTLNPINSLEGQPNALTDGLLFTGNSQESNSWIDKYVPNANGVEAFIESGYGTVAVQQSIPESRRTFCFSYALAKLNDGETPNTREELLNRLLTFFDIYTAVPDNDNSNPLQCTVYPNPVNSNTLIQYFLPEDSQVSLEIFNSTGQKVMLPVNENQIQGAHSFSWNTERLPEGIYYFQIKAGNQVITKKIIKMKR
jgi:hypothetical protein